MSALSDGVSSVPEGVPEHDADAAGSAERLLVWQCDQWPVGRIEFRAERSGTGGDCVAVFVPVDGKFGVLLVWEDLHYAMRYFNDACPAVCCRLIVIVSAVSD